MGTGYKIKELAELKEVNLKELSRRADVSYNTLYAIVQRDNESVRPDILTRIAKALDVSIYELLGIDRKEFLDKAYTYETFGDSHPNKEEKGKDPKDTPTILYKCDRRACEKCNPECEYTKDIRHARNYELQNDVFVEK